jgi:hypothetical protein
VDMRFWRDGLSLKAVARQLSKCKLDVV